MPLSVFDLFKIGIGPSSSPTVAPMKAAVPTGERLRTTRPLARVAPIQPHLFGSLELPGHGHGTVKAVVLGLQGEQPHLVDPVTAQQRFEQSQKAGTLTLGGTHP